MAKIASRSTIVLAEERLMNPHECQIIDNTIDLDAIERNISRRALAEVAEGHGLSLKTAITRLIEGMKGRMEPVKVPETSTGKRCRICQQIKDFKGLPNGQKTCVDCKAKEVCIDCGKPVFYRSMRCKTCNIKHSKREKKS